MIEKREVAETSDQDEATKFIVLNQPLEEIADSPNGIADMCTQIEIGQGIEDNLTFRSLLRTEIASVQAHGLSRSACFVDCAWTWELPSVQLKNLCRIGRGERRGWDKMFYPTGNHGI